MKNLFTFLLLLAAKSLSPIQLSGAVTGTVNITLRPSYVYLKTDTSEGGVLVTLSGYSTEVVSIPAGIILQILIFHLPPIHWAPWQSGMR